MNCIEYVKLDEVNPTAFLPLLNNQKIREHLVAHQLFDAKSVKAWLETKVEVDSSPGCKVRAIVVDKQLGVAYNLKTRNMKLQLSWVMIIGAWEEKYSMK